MSNKFEQKDAASAEAQRNFKNSLINHILDLSVPKIIANTKGRNATERDLAEVMGDMMDQYKNSDMTKKMLGIENYQDWDSFFDEVINIVFRKVQGAKKNDILPDNPPPLKSQDLKQKNLF